MVNLTSVRLVHHLQANLRVHLQANSAVLHVRERALPRSRFEASRKKTTLAPHSTRRSRTGPTLFRVQAPSSDQAGSRSLSWPVSSGWWRSAGGMAVPGRGFSSWSAGSHFVEQDFDYFLVLDFEATCLEKEKIVPQEVIEFPVLKVSGRTFATESTFHQYVEPQVHGVGDFCTKLTGITPAMVKGQPTFEQTLKLFNDWMEREGLNDPNTKSIFVTCGDWDLKTMLPSQCAYFEIPYYSYFRKWINIKKAFAAVTSRYPRGMMQMLEQLRIEHVGRHHSGIDDCRNIAAILCGLAERRFKYKQTGSR